MKLRSLGYRTDLMVLAHSGRVTDRGDYLVAESPRNPAYHWGNLLVFPAAPGPGDLEAWTELFARELGGRKGLRHVCFGWDGVDGDAGDIEPFLRAGFTVERCTVLTATEVEPPPSPEPGLEVRPLDGDADWKAAFELQLECNDRIEEEAFRSFALRRQEDTRAAIEAGAGRWYGAFADERLVADLGVVVADSLGRYQDVKTHPDYRRRGICRRLVAESARDARRELGADTLVIVADTGSPAARVYGSVGFAEAERQLGACRAPRELFRSPAP